MHAVAHIFQQTTNISENVADRMLYFESKKRLRNAGELLRQTNHVLDETACGILSFACWSCHCKKESEECFSIFNLYIF